MKNPIKIDDLGVPLFLETPTCRGGPILWNIDVGHSGCTGRVEHVSCSTTRANSFSRRHLQAGGFPAYQHVGEKEKRNYFPWIILNLDFLENKSGRAVLCSCLFL